MNKLEKFFHFVDLGLLSLAVLVEEQVIGALRDARLSGTATFLITAAVLIATFKAGEWFVVHLVENHRWLRAAIIIDDFVEGTWVDAVEIDGRKCYGLFTIEFKEGRLDQAGELFSADGHSIASWITVASRYESSTLTSVYQVNYLAEDRVERPYGVSICSFVRQVPHKAPKTVNGTFYDIATDFLTKSFEGYKVTENKLLSELSAPATRGEALKRLFQSEFFA